MVKNNKWRHIKFYTLGDLSIPFENNEIRFLVASGNSIRVNYNGNYYVLNMGDFLLINRNAKCNIIGDASALMISLFLDRKDYSDKYGNSFFDDLEACSAFDRTKSDKKMMEILRKIINIRINHDQYSYVDVMGAYYDLLAILFRNYVKHGMVVEKGKSKIYTIKNYLDLNYQKDISLKATAKKFYFSVPYLSRLFKSTFNVSFHEYITDLRLENAKIDMLQTDKKLTDVAFDNGFPNVGSFNAAFRGKYKRTPGMYRTIHKNRMKEMSKAREYVEPKKQMKKIIDSEYIVNSHTLSVNDHKNEAIMREPWRELINIGEAKSVLDDQMKEQIQMAQENIGFKYGRIWGLFTDKMILDHDENISFNKVDSVLDVMLNNDLIPFIELGNKILQVHVNAKQSFKKEDSNMLVYQDYLPFLKSFLNHCVARYGKKQMSQWQFEYWYPSESVLNSKWMPSKNKQKVITYLKKFSQIKKLIKSVSKDIKIGGCGLSLDIDFDSAELIVKNWQNYSLPDFISVYVYAQNFSEQDDSSIKNSISRGADMSYKMIKKFKQILRKENVDWPLYVTEWNISVSDSNYIHDSVFKGAFLITNILQMLDDVEMLGYWRLSDLNVYMNTRQSQLLHGGAGLLTSSGIKKAAYYALELLKKANGDIIYNRDGILVTTNGSEGINVLVNNYKYFGSLYYLIREDSLDPRSVNKVFENRSNLKGEITLDNLLAGNYQIHEWTLDGTNGDILSTYLDWGFSKKLGKEELDYLKHRQGIKLQVKEQKCLGKIKLKYNLGVNGVKLYQFQKV